MKKVLIFAEVYLPGIKGGGPIQSNKNLIDNLAQYFDFYLITSDRDLGDESPYRNIQTGTWMDVGNAKVMYLESINFNYYNLKLIINDLNPNHIYLNSFFSFKFSILPIILNKLNIINPNRIIVAPRGEFSPGAMKLKIYKKKIYILLAKLLKVYDRVFWHATNSIEKNYIEKQFGNKAKINIAENMTANYSNLIYTKNALKEKGKIKIIFLSRIHPKKNLKMALELLESVDGEVTFDIFGPIEDKNYWNECKEVINFLPSNISINYKGILLQDQIFETFKEYHVFLFPTLGENFGHVISESLISGCPVIVSDQTPWLSLRDNNAGWSIPLKEKDLFSKAIQSYIDMNNFAYEKESQAAFEYGKFRANNIENVNNYIELFQ